MGNGFSRGVNGGRRDVTKYQVHSKIALNSTRPLKSVTKTIQVLKTPCTKTALAAVNPFPFLAFLPPSPPVRNNIDSVILDEGVRSSRPISTVLVPPLLFAMGTFAGEGSKCAARRRLVPKMPALREPKQDVATQREKMIAPVGPNKWDPKS
jgi:hypothetical protein